MFLVFQTEAMLKTAEELAGPYVWGQYDVLVLPPSFPYGGMENPCLTFATPTLLVRRNRGPIRLFMMCQCHETVSSDQLFPVCFQAGDKSLSGVSTRLFPPHHVIMHYN